MQKNDLAICIQGVSKKYTYISGNGNTVTKNALYNINLSIKKGEIIGIIGPNGSGKTTLLKMLGGTIKPSSGKIKIFGKVASIIDIGSGINPELSGYDNIFFMGNLYGFSNKEISSKVDKIIDFSGIKHYIHNPVKNYSNGMYLRLSFSIITHLDFDIYLFDEVIAVGDFEFQEKCKYQFERLIQQKKTILLVTHQMQQLMEGFTNIHILKDGRITHSGNYFDSINKHLDSFGDRLEFYENNYKFKNYSLKKVFLQKATITERDPIIFTFELDTNEKYIQQKMQFGIVLYNQMSVAICSSFTVLEKQPPFQLQLFFPENLLIKGRYYIDIYMRDITDVSNFVKIKKALIFNVLEANDEKENLYLGLVKPNLVWM